MMPWANGRITPGCERDLQTSAPSPLLHGLDGFGFVGVPHPVNGFGRGHACQNGHARQHCPRAAAAAETTDLDEPATARPHERGLDLPRSRFRILGQPEVPLLDQIRGPAWLPSCVEVETK